MVTLAVMPSNGPPSSAAGPSKAHPPDHQSDMQVDSEQQHPQGQPHAPSHYRSSYAHSPSTTRAVPPAKLDTSHPPTAFYPAYLPWTLPQYSYSPGAPRTLYQMDYSKVQFQHYMPQPQNTPPGYFPQSKEPKKPPSPSPSPPPPEAYRDWDAVLKKFLTGLGLAQTLRGFEADILVMNDDWERSKVPPAIEELVRDLSKLNTSDGEKDRDTEPSETQKRPFSDRKLDHVHFASGVEPRSQTSINKSISRFLAQNLARNDTSNRAEFLYSLAEKRRRLDEEADVGGGGGGGAADAESSSAVSSSSCARTDAKPIDRDVQMKYDIAKNEEGPLRRTVRSHARTNVQNDGEKDDKGKQRAASGMDGDDGCLTTRHPGLDGRLRDIEAHLAVRYVPSPPGTILARLKFLEDHIVRLEKDYPPWAALHFNQPNRGWPPPPRTTPIIVPPHLRAPAPSSTPAPGSADANTGSQQATTAPLPSPSVTAGGGRVRNNKSSLHRAVMEKLEVQRAMSDLAGRGEG